MAINCSTDGRSLQNDVAQQHHRHAICHTGSSTFGDTAMPWYDRDQSAQTGTQLLGHAGGNGGYNTFIGFNKQQHRG